MKDKKLCVDCTYFMQTIDKKELCTHNAATSVRKDLVVGMRTTYDSCQFQRAGGLCSPSAYNFKPKKGITLNG